jgi:hypothetical protein
MFEPTADDIERIRKHEKMVAETTTEEERQATFEETMTMLEWAREEQTP